MTDENSLTVPGRYEAIRTLCEFVAGGARDAGLDENTVYHLELSCDEASTNIIEHAYGAEDLGEITASYTYSAGQFTITLQDTGKPFDPDSIQPPSIPEDITNMSGEAVSEQIQVGGLGLHFIRQLMDTVSYSYDPEHGNKLVMTKRIAAKGGE